MDMRYTVGARLAAALGIISGTVATTPVEVAAQLQCPAGYCEIPTGGPALVCTQIWTQTYMYNGVRWCQYWTCGGGSWQFAAQAPCSN
jgi:hypothetical protein